MHIATKTLAAIDAVISKDQGASFREALRVLMPKMEDAYRGKSDPFRSHLGASLIGRECGRQLWYSFHWCQRGYFEPRVLRLFNRGHLEEARFIALLQIIKLQVWYETADGGQFKFDHHDGHFGSALDAVVKDCPDIPPDTPAYGEFKTMAKKKFSKLIVEGMQELIPEHYAQVQICMHKMGLPYCLYMVVCKDDDELHAEILTYDAEVAERYLARGKMIIFDKEPGPRISSSPGWYQCKYCEYTDLCHGQAVPEINCRTCLYSTPGKDAKWFCSLDNEHSQDGYFYHINSKAAYDGCKDHVFNPGCLNGVEYHGPINGAIGIDITLPTGDRILHGPQNVTSLDLKVRGL